MAIYNPPKSIEIPKFDFTDIDNSSLAEETFIKKLKQFLLQRKTGSHIGEILQFPVADGYAQYMVASLKPVELIHLPLGDAWHFEYAGLLKSKDIILKINSQIALAKLFS